MHKGIYLQTSLPLGPGPTAAAGVTQALQAAFARLHPDLHLRIERLSAPNAGGVAKLRVYIEGDQEPAADFAAWTRAALRDAVAAIAPPAAGRGLRAVEEVEDDDERGLVLPPGRRATPHGDEIIGPGPEPAAPEPPAAASLPTAAPPSVTKPGCASDQKPG